MNDEASVRNGIPSSKGEGGVRSVARALALLDAFDKGDSTHSVASLSRLVGLPRTTTLRMVDTLIDEGMLMMGGDGIVRVGPRLIRWGALAAAVWNLLPEVSERMRQVAEVTGETVSIYIRRGLGRVVIGQAPSPHTLRHSVQVGDELPLWGGAAAIVLIGMEPQQESETLIAEIAAKSNGLTTKEELTALVSEARRNEYAISHGGRAEGTSGLAIPLRPVQGIPGVPAGLALGGPSFRFTEEAVPRFLVELRDAASDISKLGLPAALS